ncbi:hypothetical protein ACP4OV_019047 [Aristida adscensionis]
MPPRRMILRFRGEQLTTIPLRAADHEDEEVSTPAMPPADSASRGAHVGAPSSVPGRGGMGEVGHEDEEAPPAILCAERPSRGAHVEVPTLCSGRSNRSVFNEPTRFRNLATKGFSPIVMARGGGGYNLNSMSNCVCECIKALLGDDTYILRGRRLPYEETWSMILKTRDKLKHFWKIFGDNIPKEVSSKSIPYKVCREDKFNPNVMDCMRTKEKAVLAKYKIS